MKIGIYGSCQLVLCSPFFFNKKVLKKNDIQIVFSLAFFDYDSDYIGYKGILDYNIFNKLDCLIIEINNLENQASSKKIIEYCSNKNIKIIKTFLLKFPIYPINWSGKGDNKVDYLNWKGLHKINYVKRFEECIESLKKSNEESDLSLNLSEFIEKNFRKKLLFTHSLHPTNVLLYELWRYIFEKLSINIDDYNYIFNSELILCWYNPFTTKMISDLNIEFKTIVDDNFYIDRYKNNKHLFM